jgi:hypothetical protein
MELFLRDQDKVEFFLGILKLLFLLVQVALFLGSLKYWQAFYYKFAIDF